MGSSCGFTKKEVGNTDTIIRASSRMLDDINSHNVHNLYDEKSDDQFQNMEEYENNYNGEGIKYMKGYKCGLAYDELYNLRIKFWSKILY